MPIITGQQYSDLKALGSHPGWRVAVEYMEGQIKGLQVDLERKEFTGLGQVALLQGKLQAYRNLLDYPRTRCEEWEKKKREE